MISVLVYKDIKLLIKDNLLLLLGQCLLILILISANLGIVGYSMLTLALCWSYLMTVSAKEKVSKGNLLLIVTPYKKNQIILGKYITVFLLFCVVTVFYYCLSQNCRIINISLFEPLSWNVLAITGLSVSVFVGVTIPMYLKFDDSIVKIVSIIMLLGTLYIGYGVYKQLSVETVEKIMNWVNQYVAIISIITSILVLCISYIITLTLIKKTEY